MTSKPMDATAQPMAIHSSVEVSERLFTGESLSELCEKYSIGRLPAANKISPQRRKGREVFCSISFSLRARKRISSRFDHRTQGFSRATLAAPRLKPRLRKCGVI